MTGELKIITNYSLCATCKGKCCNRLPGIYHPDDFRRIYNQDITVDLLVTIFKTGTVALDWWEGDPRSGQNQFYEEGDEEKEDDTLLDKCYYLRPKTINALNKLKDPAWRDNPCMNWSIGRGCSLDENHRPYGCRVLVPTEPINGEYYCEPKKEDKADKHALAIEWAPYQDLIVQAIKIYENNKTQ